MPKENKHARGRRDKDSKRKRPEEEDDGHETKRQRSLEAGEGDAEMLGTDNTEAYEGDAPILGGIERPFYGLLEEEEQEYFRRADELLELNDFPSDEERSLFLANVYREAEGKELKIANSQSCSRLMERLILLSTADQKKKLFEKFSGHFLHLIQHRFASHCCETLFIHSAPVVTQELTRDSNEEAAVQTEVEGDAVYVSMENLFLYTLNELEGQMGFLLTDRFASHALRVLLVVLSGQPLSKASTKSLLQSRKKEKIGITGLEASAEELSLDRRAVPESFQFAVDKFISDTAAGLDSTSIPVLATHPTGNPSLQLLLELELTRQTKKKASGDGNSIIRKFLPDDVETENSRSSSFINGLIYEPIGSRLLETIVTFAPGKLFKQIYRSTFKERIGSLARNETSSYVVVKVLERVSKEDLQEAVTGILPQIPNLVERSRLTIIKTLLERCHARNAHSSIELLTNAISEAYGSEPSTLLLKMTHTSIQIPVEVDPNADAATKVPEPRANPATLHGSLLAQSLLAIPGAPSTLIQTSLLALAPSTLLQFSLTPQTSHILQASLVPLSDAANVAFRRKLINHFVALTPSPVITLASSKSGSHVLDALYEGTAGLMSLKERICGELAQNMASLREDFVGRVVLRNWMVELFVRRRGEWITKVKAGEGGPGKVIGARGIEEESKVALNEKGKGVNGAKGTPLKGKSAIEIARENFAAGKRKKIHRSRATGANAV